MAYERGERVCLLTDVHLAIEAGDGVLSSVAPGAIQATDAVFDAIGDIPRGTFRLQGEHRSGTEPAFTRYAARPDGRRRVASGDAATERGSCAQ